MNSIGRWEESTSPPTKKRVVERSALIFDSKPLLHIALESDQRWGSLCAAEKDLHLIGRCVILSYIYD